MFWRRADRADFDDLARNIDPLNSTRRDCLTGREEGVESGRLGWRESENGSVLKQDAVDVAQWSVERRANATRHNLPFGGLRNRRRWARMVGSKINHGLTSRVVGDG